MNALWNAPISDRFSSLCARVFSPAAAILESEKTLGTRLGRFYRSIKGYLKDTMASFDKNYVTSLHIPPQFWNFIALYHVENVPPYSLMKNSLNETTKKNAKSFFK